MRHTLAPASTEGAAACEVAEGLAAHLAATAEERDRAGRFDPATVAALQASGLGRCCVPAELGGWGVHRLADVVAVAARLGRGDGSTALVAHMHLSATWSLSRAWAAQEAAGGPAAGGLAALLAEVAEGRSWLCAAVTEAGTNYFHPRTELRPAEGGGWVISGRKVFATGSPAATHFSSGARIVGGDLDGRLATVVVPAAASGVVVTDDWDGLGMRASGSGEVRFERCALPADAIVLPGGPFGAFNPAALCGRAFGNIGNVAVMQGIAEAAHALVLTRVREEGRVSERPLSARPTVRHALADVEVDLLTGAAVLAQFAARADVTAGGPLPDLDGAHRFMADFQAAKLTANRLASAVVDRCLTLAGGGGYVGASALARLARDVRAGPFMQPFSPHEARGYMGAVLVGAEPDPES